MALGPLANLIGQIVQQILPAAITKLGEAVESSKENSRSTSATSESAVGQAKAKTSESGQRNRTAADGVFCCPKCGRALWDTKSAQELRVVTCTSCMIRVSAKTGKRI